MMLAASRIAAFQGRRNQGRNLSKIKFPSFVKIAGDSPLPSPTTTGQKQNTSIPGLNIFTLERGGEIFLAFQTLQLD